MNNQTRFRNLDMLRGFIMILMAIDHCYSIFYQTHYAESWNSSIPNYGSLAIFFTRWISNICAPGFALLMGMGMIFSFSRKLKVLDKRTITLHFIKRGIILILLQQFLDLSFLILKLSTLEKSPPFRGGILYALGFSLIFSSFFIKLPYRVQILLGTIILLTNYFIASTILISVSNNTIINLLFIPGVNKFSSVNYPAFPWLGITIIGLGIGGFIIKNSNLIKINYFKTGVTFLIVFILLRFLNFGDYSHIVNSNNIIDFLAVIKYPPSIEFVIMTMGLLSLSLGAINKFETYSIIKPLLVFGQAPLFFYFAHLYLFIILSKFTNHAFPLSVMYLFWIVGLIIIFPMCKYYIQFKSHKPNSSLWRYF